MQPLASAARQRCLRVALLHGLRPQKVSTACNVRAARSGLRTGLPLQVLENTAALSRLLDVSNLVLTALFAAEMVLKLYALGFREYLRYEEVS